VLSTLAARSIDAPAPSAPMLLPVRTGCAYDPAGLVGNTPVLWIDEPFGPPGRGFWAKLEGSNPGGIKDRAALHMLARARERGELRPGDPIVESSSGTFGLGLALAAAVFGHPVTVVTDPGLEEPMRRLLRAYGATVEVVDRPHPTGGWQQARRDRVTAIRRTIPRAYLPNQYDNPDAIEAYAPLAAELVAQLGRVDVLVCSVGTGGHSAGVFAALRRHNPHARLVGVDTVGSVLFGQPARPRLMRGLGNSIRPANLRRDMFAEVHWVGPAEAVWACRALAARHCVTGGWSVGAVALVAGWLARTEPPETRIAAVFPDGPHRYLGSIFSDEYCHHQGLLNHDLPGQPDEIAHPGEREATRWTRCRALQESTR
jgi:cysteine synthase A